MKNCDVGPNLICKNCGRRASSTTVIKPCPSGGAGDRVASLLFSVGITESRADKLARLAGLSSCGCGGRREAMNRVGREWLGIGDSSEETGLTAIPDKAEPGE